MDETCRVEGDPLARIGSAPAEIAAVDEYRIDRQWQSRVVGADLEPDLLTIAQEACGDLLLLSPYSLVDIGSLLEESTDGCADPEISLRRDLDIVAAVIAKADTTR